ncbi:family 10 glycosylhydrolase [candidate division KSB1 bacterium]|nr:family 10 glycosylhydrolase [candidate division KSB1 bacterium]
MKVLRRLTQWIIIFSMALVIMGSVCKRMRYPIKEARGLWVTRWEWAARDDSMSSTDQQERIKSIFDQATELKSNIIFFQIRGNGDAFYRSNFEPWSDVLTGKLGKDPGWDPLAFAIDEAHKRGLELHAWFNTFPAWRGTVPPLHTQPEHVYNAHPEWLVCDNEGVPMKLSGHYVSLSPGIPAVRDYLIDVAMDIITHYDIDGFHFDYIRYPEEANTLGYSHDPVSVNLFNSASGNPERLNWEDWQRENINIFVRTFYDEATVAKPWLKISAAVIGKYNYSSWNGYHVVFQDAMQWIEEGKMDFIVPMIYWQTDHETAPFVKIARDWLTHYRYDRYIFPGMMINSLGSENWPADEVVKQIEICRKYGNGMVFFSYSGLSRAIEAIEVNEGQIYPSNIPPMSWKDDKPPMDPKNLRAQFLANGAIKLLWTNSNHYHDSGDVVRFNVYRTTGEVIDFNDARNLLHVTANSDTIYYDITCEYGNRYVYAVTALDRVGNESPPSNVLEIDLPLLVMSAGEAISSTE